MVTKFKHGGKGEEQPSIYLHASCHNALVNAALIRGLFWIGLNVVMFWMAVLVITKGVPWIVGHWLSESRVVGTYRIMSVVEKLAIVLILIRFVWPAFRDLYQFRNRVSFIPVPFEPDEPKALVFARKTIFLNDFRYLWAFWRA